MVDIHLYGYNIRDGMYGGIKSALHVIVQANMDLGVLFKTKIMNGVYMRRSLDYNVIVLAAPIKHQVGVALLFCDYPHCNITVNQSSAPMFSSSSW